jgi:hypothetical protein
LIKKAKQRAWFDISAKHVATTGWLQQLNALRLLDAEQKVPPETSALSQHTTPSSLISTHQYHASCIM